MCARRRRISTVFDPSSKASANRGRTLRSAAFLASRIALVTLLHDGHEHMFVNLVRRLQDHRRGFRVARDDLSIAVQRDGIRQQFRVRETKRHYASRLVLAFGYFFAAVDGEPFESIEESLVIANLDVE